MDDIKQTPSLVQPWYADRHRRNLAEFRSSDESLGEGEQDYDGGDDDMVEVWWRHSEGGLMVVEEDGD
ncbi:hypothetical protein QVD17_19280 [Tagetes erecta]|uniref:Uncharacterized protein n=1 Tax=Tagetes erecta TaxID=13708 RepID=A0AAD8KJN3_TARER|nr:hypothetical protein QVD17_19280 [Tagetes erecta]